MRNSLRRVMACIVGCMVVSGIGSCLWAVPAYTGWQVRTLADGSQVTVRQMGDEFYHYWETKDGKLAVEQADGTFIVREEAVPSRAAVKARRTKAQQRRMKAVGSTPNLAPRGVVILVNFSDCAMGNGHTNAVFDNMCNATNCTTNSYEGIQYGSAAQYFSDQSNGTYRPQFDLFGPVTLPHPVAYYGEAGTKVINGEEDEQNDLYMADFVIDAVLAAENAGCDFSQYDSDGDEWVDFVYFIYAGKGQAAGGTSETIWPHNWNFVSALFFGSTHGTSEYYFYDYDNYNLLNVDGVYIGNYACSAELDYMGQLGGIGTLCHEFGHVMGLPDLYDTEYGYNYENDLTPGTWDIMDGGAYNGNGHCPPNYSPWEKYFFGWVTPANPGNKAANGTLYANGTEDYNVYQINSSGSLMGATDAGLCYYLENRQQSGWDSYIPSHGMVVWRVDYDEDLWTSNAPNNTENDPHLTVSRAYNTWEVVYDKPVTDIRETNGVVTFKYKGGEEEKAPSWYYYDDNSYATSIGSQGNPFWWGIMIPAGTIQEVEPYLTHIAVATVANYNTQPLGITIHRGGSYPMNITKVHEETVPVQAAESISWQVIELSEPVAVQKNKNLWIILNEGTDSYPALTCNDTGDANGRWFSENGTTWEDLASYDLNYTFLLRAYIQDFGGTNEDIEIVESPESRGKSQKILHNGQIFIIRDGKIYDILGTKVQ